MIAIASVFFFASCCNKAKETPVEDEAATCCELTEEQKADKAAWEDWDNQTDEQKDELLAKAKECIDKKMAEKAEKCDGEQKEVCPEKAAKCAAFKAKWEDWDNLDRDAKKALVDETRECCKKKCEKEGQCKKPE